MIGNGAPTPSPQSLELCTALLAEKDKHIAELHSNVAQLKAELKAARRTQGAFALAVIIMLLAAVILLLIDILNGHIGYVRY